LAEEPAQEALGLIPGDRREWVHGGHRDGLSLSGGVVKALGALMRCGSTYSPAAATAACESPSRSAPQMGH
jgi:hypothetical protein